MPSKQPIRELPPVELVLAAIDRAVRHRRHDDDRSGVWISDVKKHLGLPHTGATTVWLRPVWQQLEAEHLIEQNRDGGLPRCQLTRTGKLRLAAAMDAEGLYQLPESPQHARWRKAHHDAAERIEDFRRALRLLMDEADRLLEDQPPSGAWHEMAQDFEHACKRLGSATHCLHEWPEPDDATADVDDAPYSQIYRRDISQWDRD
jgi:hypothetical protein